MIVSPRRRRFALLLHNRHWLPAVPGPTHPHPHPYTTTTIPLQPTMTVASALHCFRVPLVALSLAWLACLAPQAAAQRMPTRSPTWSPTRAPTVAPQTVYCNMTEYRNVSAGVENCLTCRNDHFCAWCIPSNGAPSYCFNNVDSIDNLDREVGCVGTVGSYSDDICHMRVLNVSTAVAISIFFCILLACCCCIGGCFWLRRRNMSMVTVTNGGISMLIPANRGQPPPMQQQPMYLAQQPTQMQQPMYLAQQPNYAGQQFASSAPPPAPYPAQPYYVQPPPSNGVAPRPVSSYASPPPGSAYADNRPSYL